MRVESEFFMRGRIFYDCLDIVMDELFNICFDSERKKGCMWGNGIKGFLRLIGMIWVSSIF